MAEEIYGPAFEIHGGGLDLVFPHHENEVAQSRALGHPFAAIWAHNGMLRFTGEKMSKSIGNVTTIREALDEWGREAVLVFFLTASWRKPIDFSEETMAQAAARRETLRNAFTRPAAAHDEAGWAPFAAALDDDFDTPAALAVLHDWASSGQLELLRRGLAVFGLESLAERDEAPAEVAELAERRAEARAGAGLRDLRPAARRARRARLGRCATGRTAATTSCARDARARLRPAGGARGAARAPRGARALGDRAGAQGRAVARGGAPAEDEGRPRALRARGDARPSGRARARRAVPLRRRLRARRRRAAAARRARPRHRPAQPRRRRRSADGAGATGVVVPAHGSAVVTPAVARASAGAVEHLPIAVVTNLARYLEEVKGADLWVYGAAGARAPVDVGDRSLRRAGARARRGGEGPAAARPAHLRRARLDPARGQVESLNVSVAAAVLLYEARRQRG